MFQSNAFSSVCIDEYMLILGPYLIILKFKSLSTNYSVILLPAHPASFAHKFLFQRVPGSPGMQ